MHDRIKELRKEIQEKRKEIIALQKELPLEEVKDYTLKDKEGNSVLLSELFGDSDELLVIHNMGKECVYCTMWADGFRAYAEMITDRMPWVLTSPNEPSVLKSFSEERGWNFPCLSFHGTDFGFDLGYEKRKGKHSAFHPGVSALIRKEGKMYRTAHDSFGPGDNYNPVWHFFDLFPRGAGNWNPKYSY